MRRFVLILLTLICAVINSQAQTDLADLFDQRKILSTSENNSKTGQVELLIQLNDHEILIEVSNGTCEEIAMETNESQLYLSIETVTGVVLDSHPGTDAPNYITHKLNPQHSFHSKLIIWDEYKDLKIRIKLDLFDSVVYSNWFYL